MAGSRPLRPRKNLTSCPGLVDHYRSYSKEYFDKFRENFIAGWGGFPLVGTPEQVTDKLLQLSSTGVDGTLISMVDYNAELPYWNEKVMPLLEQAGLRNPKKKDA